MIICDDQKCILFVIKKKIIVFSIVFYFTAYLLGTHTTHEQHELSTAKTLFTRNDTVEFSSLCRTCFKMCLKSESKKKKKKLKFRKLCKNVPNKIKKKLFNSYKDLVSNSSKVKVQFCCVLC